MGFINSVVLSVENCWDGAYIFSNYNRYPDEIEIDYSNSFIYQGGLGTTIVTRNKYSSFTIFTIFYNPFFIKVEHIFDSLELNYFLKDFLLYIVLSSRQI